MRRKGFTLIELLAVLVVLAILALISVPITIRIINNARENSYKRSIESYGRAVEGYIGNYLLNNTSVDYRTIKLSDIENNINTGSSVKCTKLSFQDNADIVLRGCQVNNSKLYKYINRQVVEDIYQVGELIKVKGIEFYVIENSGSDKDYITALKKEPFTIEEVNTYGWGYVNNNANGKSGSAYDIKYLDKEENIYKSTGYGGMAYYRSGTCDGYYKYAGCNPDYKISNIKHTIDRWTNIVFNGGELTDEPGYKARLININELESLGYVYNEEEKKYPENDNVPSWIKTNYTYWTMSPVYEHTVWLVWYSYVAVHGDVGDGYYAVRPVINVKKSAVE